MIEDLEEGAAARDRRGHMVAASILLVVGCIIAWAAATSTAFQGPFATPAPSAPVFRYTPEPSTRLDPAVGAFVFVYRPVCVIPGGTSPQVVFVGEQIVTLTRPLTDALATCAPAPRPPFER